MPFLVFSIDFFLGVCVFQAERVLGRWWEMESPQGPWQTVEPMLPKLGMVHPLRILVGISV